MAVLDSLLDEDCVAAVKQEHVQYPGDVYSAVQTSCRPLTLRDPLTQSTVRSCPGADGQARPFSYGRTATVRPSSCSGGLNTNVTWSLTNHRLYGDLGQPASALPLSSTSFQTAAAAAASLGQHLQVPSFSATLLGPQRWQPGGVTVPAWSIGEVRCDVLLQCQQPPAQRHLSSPSSTSTRYAPPSGKYKRPRRRFTMEQQTLLRHSFHRSIYPSPVDAAALAVRAGLSRRQVSGWFGRQRRDLLRRLAALCH